MDSEKSASLSSTDGIFLNLCTGVVSLLLERFTLLQFSTRPCAWGRMAKSITMYPAHCTMHGYLWPAVNVEKGMNFQATGFTSYNKCQWKSSSIFSLITADKVTAMGTVLCYFSQSVVLFIDSIKKYLILVPYSEAPCRLSVIIIHVPSSGLGGR